MYYNFYNQLMFAMVLALIVMTIVVIDRMTRKDWISIIDAIEDLPVPTKVDPDKVVYHKGDWA